MNSWQVQQLKFAFGIGGFMSFYGIVGAIVLFGDKVGINIPQKGVVIACVLLTVPFAILIGYVSTKRAKKKEEKAKAEAEAKAAEKGEKGEKAEEKADDEKAAKAAPTPAADGDFKSSTEEVVQFLRGSNLGEAGKDAVYSLPWYIVAGTTKSGKSSLVLGSQLTFQNLPSQRQSEQQIIRPTKSVDWRVTNDAVFVDTAGHFQAEAVDKNEWSALLDTIKKYRSNRPLDGFILTVNAEKILNTDEREIEESAKLLRARLDEAMLKLKVRFPVYLVFTKADSIEGFRDSFSSSKQEGKNLVWGATIPLEKSENGQSLFDSEFELLQNSIMKRRLMRLSAPFPPVRQLRIFNFPLHFGSARRKLGTFVSALFKPNPFSENPFLRGFYFTASPVSSSKQGGAQTVGQTFFTERLFRDVILRDKDLVRTFQEQKQKPPIMGWLLTFIGAFLTLLFLVFAGISLSNNKVLLDKGSKRGEAVLTIVKNDENTNPLDKNPADTEAEITAINNLRKVLQELDDYDRNGAPWFRSPVLGWGLYSNRLYRENLLPIYFNAVERRFKTPAINKIKEELRQFSTSNPAKDASKLTPEEETKLGEMFNLLKAYLMLTGEYKDYANEAEITNVLKKYWVKESKTPSGMDGTAEDILIFWAHQIDRREAPPVGFPRIPYDEEAQTLVTAVRKKLQIFPAPNQYYKLKVTEISQQIDKNVGQMTVEGILARKTSSTIFLEGKYQIPGAYTREGFRLMKKAIDEAGAKLNENNWVMGEQAKSETNIKDAAATVQALYFRDYIDHWNNFIRDIRVTYTKENAKQALEEFSQKSSPVSAMTQEIVYHTSFTEKAKSSGGGWWQSIKDFFSGLTSSKEDFGTGGNSDIEIAFRPVSSFVGESGEKTTPLAKYEGYILNVYNKFKNFDNNKINQISQDFAKSETKDFTELKTNQGNVEKELKDFKEPASAQIVADFLRQPLNKLGELLGETGKGEITKLWAEKIVPEANEAFKGFPFEDGATEAQIKKLEAFLNPTDSGTLTKFFNDNLKNDFKESGGVYTPNDPNKYNEQFVAFLNSAFRLREKLFGKSSATINYSYTFDIQVPSDVTIKEGTVDGEPIEAGKTKNIKFPAGQGKVVGVNIVFSAAETTSSATPTPSSSPTSPSPTPAVSSSPTVITPIEFKTDWGLFRLIKEGAGQSSSSPMTLTFNRGGKTITINIKGDLFEKNFDTFRAVRNMPQTILK